MVSYMRLCHWISSLVRKISELLEEDVRNSTDNVLVLLGVLIGVVQLGILSGPLIGGAFTQYASWRWCKLRQIFDLPLPRRDVLMGANRFLYQPSMWCSCDISVPLRFRSIEQTNQRTEHRQSYPETGSRRLFPLYSHGHSIYPCSRVGRKPPPVE
jgi:hypothetical protein